MKETQICTFLLFPDMAGFLPVADVKLESTKHLEKVIDLDWYVGLFR